MPEIQPSGRNPGRAEILAREAGSSQNAGSPTIRPDLARTAGPPASGRISGETGQDGQLPVNWPDSGNFCRNMYMPNIKKKIFLYYFILIFFILWIKFYINMIKLKYKKYL
jgi:hypothetical protein